MRSPRVDFDLRFARADRAERHGRTHAEAGALYHKAAKSAACCSDCGRALAPTDSVTMTRRDAGRRRNPDWIRVPICLLCTLDEIARHWSGRRDMYNTPRWHRTRCLNCDRLIRIYGSSRNARTGCGDSRNARTCCEGCQRAVRNERNKLRRRVRHTSRMCVRCGARFVPKRTDAVTCSNRCRQAMHRMQAPAATSVIRDKPRRAPRPAAASTSRYGRGAPR
jgi:hypothetical protein